MNGLEITFVTLFALVLICMPIIVVIDTNCEKRKTKRKFNETKNGDVYIDKDDDEDPFDNMITYAVILEKEMNKKGKRYVKYKRIVKWTDENGEHRVTDIRSQRFSSFLYQYKKTDLKYDGNDNVQ